MAIRQPQRKPSTLFFALLAISFRLAATQADLENILSRMEEEVHAFRDYFESFLSERCHNTTMGSCLENNFDTCLAEYRDQVCPESLGEGTILHTPGCGATSDDGNSECLGLFMFNNSTFQLKEGVGLNEFGLVKAKAVESICLTRLLEQNMIERYNNLREYWSESLGVNEVPFVYVGMSDSTFRVVPARQREHDKCATYDPSTRPWYIAAASGARDVILIVDNSGSIVRKDLSSMLETAVLTLLNSLGEYDRVGIVKMDENPSFIVPKGFPAALVQATERNKKALKRAIRDLQPSGEANTSEAFTVAFDALENSIEDDLGSQCNSAILLFTEGKIDDIDVVVDIVNSRKAQVNQQNFMTFTYEFQTTPTNESGARDLACRTRGLWSRVVSPDGIEESMSSYYKFFAFGRSQNEGGTKDNVFWVEPYRYEPYGYGTTVSSPVYDRSFEPPLLVGVVGIDITIPAIEKAFPGNQRNFILNSIRARRWLSTVCPAIVVTDCQLESLRRETLETFEEEVCRDACINDAELVSLEAELCAYHGSRTSYKMESLLVNMQNDGKSFSERVCCVVGGAHPSDTCVAEITTAPTSDPTPIDKEPATPTHPQSSSPTSTTRGTDNIDQWLVAIGVGIWTIGFVIGVVLGILIAILFARFGQKSTPPNQAANQPAAPVPAPNQTAAPVPTPNQTAAPVQAPNQTAAPVPTPGDTVSHAADSGSSHVLTNAHGIASEDAFYPSDTVSEITSDVYGRH